MAKQKVALILVDSSLLMYRQNQSMRHAQGAYASPAEQESHGAGMSPLGSKEAARHLHSDFRYPPWPALLCSPTTAMPVHHPFTEDCTHVLAGMSKLS